MENQNIQQSNEPIPQTVPQKAPLPSLPPKSPIPRLLSLVLMPIFLAALSLVLWFVPILTGKNSSGQLCTQQTTTTTTTTNQADTNTSTQTTDMKCESISSQLDSNTTVWLRRLSVVFGIFSSGSIFLVPVWLLDISEYRYSKKQAF